MWKVFQYDGNYIQGNLVSKHSSEDAALKAAKKKINYTYCEKNKKGKEINIWLDDVNHTPVGIIVKKTRG
ncbi:MAG: hypothetical protein ACW97P_03365 [Candidatus Hodarchaeales archaeon]|jgi:hypothetical protein